MTRFTLDRAIVRAEVERRKAPVTPEPAPAPQTTTSSVRRWSAKVFVVPAAVAEALSRLANGGLFGAAPAELPGERHSMRRHRGVYIWRPSMDQQGQTGEHEQIMDAHDVSTAEREIARLKKELH